MRDGMLLSTGTKKNQNLNFRGFDFLIFLWILGKKYHDRRKIVTPAFNFQMMEKYAARFDILGKKFIKKLKEFDADAEIEVFHLMGLFALDVICGKWCG